MSGVWLLNVVSLELNKVVNVMDVVYFVVLVFDDVIKCKIGCGFFVNGICFSVKNGVRLLDILIYIKNLLFIGKFGFLIVFDKYGDIKGECIVFFIFNLKIIIFISLFLEMCFIC